MKVLFVAIVCCAAVLGQAQEEEDGKLPETKNIATLQSALKKLLKKGDFNKIKSETVNTEDTDNDKDKRKRVTSCEGRKDALVTYACQANLDYYCASPKTSIICQKSCCLKANGISVNCGQPTGTGGTVIGEDFTPYGKVDFKCDSGKILKSGNKLRTCGLNGQWSGTPPVCDDASCDAKTDILVTYACQHMLDYYCGSPKTRVICQKSCCLRDAGLM